MDDWENEDYEPTLPGNAPVSDKWLGEDEDDDVKDNWEDEDEQAKTEDDATQASAYQRPKKKSLIDRMAEKQRLKEEEAAAKIEEKKELTPEEKLAEKIRLQKIQEEADLKIAKGLFGVEGGFQGTIEGMFPQTQAEFDQFGEALKTKITFFEDSKLYPAFVAQLFHNISLTLPAEEVKKIGISLNSIYHEKERIRKEQAKNQKKKKIKATIKMDRADDLGLADETAAYYDNDDDDFI